MPLAILALLLGALGAPDGDDPARLVARLGAARFADRQEAGEALRALGPEALGALQAARDAKDPEVRLRAEGLLQVIERSQMLGPTLVVLSDPEQRLQDAVGSLASQTGFALRAGPGLDGRRAIGKLGGALDRPIPFWEAIERLGLDAQIGPPEPAAGFLGSGKPRLSLSEPARPSWSDGPFRLAVREVGLGLEDANPLPPGPGLRFRIIRPPVRPTRLELALDLQAEPRLTLGPDCRLEIDEAVDDRGQAMVVRSIDTMVWPVAVGRPGDLPGGGPGLPVAVSLQLPAQPGRAIAKLRGTLSFQVATPRLDPLEILLPGPRDEPPPPIETESVRLRVNGMTRDLGGGWAVDLTVQPEDFEGLFARRVGIGGGRGRVFSVADGLLQGVEFVDGAGRVIVPTGTQFLGPAEGGLRLQVLLPLSDAGRPPARLRYRDTIHEPVTLRFELENIPIPTR